LTERLLSLPAYVASLAPRELADARRLVTLVPKEATAIEYRLDLAEEMIPPRALLDLDPRPIIATYRSVREGGGFGGSAEEYRRLTLEAYEAGATVDVEDASGLASGGHFADRRRVMVSAHFPIGLPEDWGRRLSSMLSTGARAVKLVAGAADLTSSLAVAALQARQCDGSVAIFPMGPASAPGRILAALFGSSLVYGSVERTTARGQIPLRDLFAVYEVHRRRRPEALLGLVAADPSASLSPPLHNALLRSRDLPFLYLPLPITDFEREKPPEILFDPPFRGFSVTRPWKRQAALAGAPSEDVLATRAANTLFWTRGRWRSENTDVDGIFDPLADHDTGEGRTAVILGAGGTARAAVVASRRLGYEVFVASRRDEEADALAAEFRLDSMAWSDVAASEADLYLNTTPLGFREGDPSAVPERVLEHRPLVFDCVYRPDGSETPTIRAARAAGCSTVDGLEMFAAQAVRQARLFGADSVTLEEVASLLRGQP
jgi:shikimate dehydrogenase/3-dehydroquinate dehydratase type I